MPLTIYDLIDDAIKIGLGAVIGAASSLAVALLKNRHDAKSFDRTANHERQKERRANRRRLIESTATATEPFIRSHRQLLIAISNSARRFDEATAKGTPLTSAQIKKEREALHVLGNAQGGTYGEQYFAASAQISFLALAAASHESKLLGALVSKGMGQRDAVLGPGTPGTLPTHAMAKAAIKEFGELRMSFITALGKLYDEL
jgi:DNA polymerase III alpha subunit